MAAKISGLARMASVAKYDFALKNVKYVNMIKTFSYINTLSEAPTKDKAYSYNGKNYKRPEFRLKKRGGDVTMESDAFWFTKDEENNEVKIHCILEVFCEGNNVYPLLIKGTKVSLDYEVNGKTSKLPLKITQSPLINKINILQDIHAEAIVQPDNILGLTTAISTMGKAKLLVTTELWWQMAAKQTKPVVKPKPKPRPKVKPVITSRGFVAAKLKVKGNNIVNEKGAVLWRCKNRVEAVKAWTVIRKHRFNKEVVVGKYRTFKYMLSGNKIPIGPKLAGEDVLPLNRKLLKVKKVNNLWGIYEGKKLHYNFRDDEAGARYAFNIMQQYQVDYRGYAHRPRPILHYFKTNSKNTAFNFTAFVKPQIHMAAVAGLKPQVGIKPLKPVKPVKPKKPVNTKPQKIDLQHSIFVYYEKDNPSVFGQLNDDIFSSECKWEYKTILKGQENFTIYYRGTSQPDTFSFLPQVYRIKVNENSGEPKIMISMIAGEDPNIIESYRIMVNIQVLPHYHPKAKKDLFSTLEDLSDGEIKYCNIVLDNYESAKFEVNDVEVSDLVALHAKIPEAIENINPVNGFSLSLDCSFESFDVLKRKLKDGFTIGSVIFELVEETEEGEVVTSSQPIPVELDLRKLVGINIGVEVPSSTSDEEIPLKFNLFNEHPFPVKIKGTEVTLLSEIGDTIYDTDLDIGNQRSDWPISLEANKANTEEVLLNKNDIDELKGENLFWTNLICEPYGMYIDEEADVIMERVIDYASGDPQIWELEIECLVLLRWEELNDEIKAPFNGVERVAIEIRQSEEDTPFGVVLSRTQPTSKVQMARSISDILHSQQLGERNYEYRIKTYYLIEEKAWTEWTTPDSTAANYLSVYPQKLEQSVNE